MAEFMIVYHFLSTFTRYLFEFDKSLLKGALFLPKLLVFRLCFNRQKPSAESEI